MNFFQDFDAIPERELVPGFFGRFVHTDELSVVRWRVTAGAKLPEHAHHNEQISMFLEGQFSLTVDGETKTCEAGEVVCIPSNVVHKGVALTDCVLIDVFRPARDDYR